VSMACLSYARLTGRVKRLIGNVQNRNQMRSHVLGWTDGLIARHTL
jgi:hypothetical protein